MRAGLKQAMSPLVPARQARQTRSRQLGYDYRSLHVLGVEGADVRVVTWLVKEDRHALARLDYVVRGVLHFDRVGEVVVVGPCNARPGDHLDNRWIEPIAWWQVHLVCLYWGSSGRRATARDQPQHDQRPAQQKQPHASPRRRHRCRVSCWRSNYQASGRPDEHQDEGDQVKHFGNGVCE